MVITVNGVRHSFDDNRGDEKLIDFIREELGLHGTKNGCGIGACGACSVLIDGKVKRSCVTKLKQVDGKNVLTIEGLESSDGTLHPIQQAFIDAGAVQCGFCTPGMIMSTVALLDNSPDPSDDEIAKAFRGNLCRCTGYTQIFQAVKDAAVKMKD
jgi:carbon-monoxide dehydrogenase small subunit